MTIKSQVLRRSDKKEPVAILAALQQVKAEARIRLATRLENDLEGTDLQLLQALQNVKGKQMTRR